MTIKRVLECLPTLNEIARSKSAKKRQQLLKEAKDCIFYAISEISLNVLNGNIPVSKQRKLKLTAHKSKLRRLALKTTPLKERKKIVIQSGGFLASLIIPAVTILADVLAKKFIK